MKTTLHRDAYVTLLTTLIIGWTERLHRSTSRDEIDELMALIEKTRVFLHNEFGVDNI